MGTGHRYSHGSRSSPAGVSANAGAADAGAADAGAADAGAADAGAADAGAADADAGCLSQGRSASGRPPDLAAPSGIRAVTPVRAAARTGPAASPRKLSR